MLNPWIMRQEAAHALCCFFGGHRRTVTVTPNQFGLPFVGIFSLTASIKSLREMTPHPIIITNDDESLRERHFLALYFHPRDTQIECYVYSPLGERMLHSSYKIREYDCVLIFVQKQQYGLHYSVAEGAAPPYTTVCTFASLTPQLPFIEHPDETFFLPN